MKQEKIELLKEELADLQLAAAHLGYSLEMPQFNWAGRNITRTTRRLSEN